MHLRKLTVPALALLSAVVLSQPAAGAADPTPSPGYRVHDYADGQAMSILPPGQNGLVNLTDLLTFETTKQRPADSDDQLAKYRDLIYGADDLSDADLSTYFDDESFGVRPTDVQRTEKPGPGVTVYRDGHDVPHVYGETDAAAAYGAGFAQAEDRLFLMDVLRHYGSGTLASFLGSSCEFEQMDHDQLLLAPYTEQRAQDQVDALSDQGPYGRLAKTMVESYVQGVNAYIAKTRTDPSALPADYVASIGLPQKWSATDVVAIASLIGGIFGKGGGAESDNANLLQYLQGKYGAADGAAAYEQLNHPDDPLAPTTTAKRFDYDSPTKPVDASLTALPDQGKDLTGGPVATTPDCAASSGGAGGLTAKPSEQQRTTTLVKGIVASLKAMPKHMSNALVVNGKRTKSGHPVAVFGPQVSYFAPQILSLEEIQSPHVSAAGASFPGTGLVELGRGQDYAWSATSSSSDIIDQRVEKVCNPAGGAAQPQGKAYVYNGVCTPMVHETYAETAVPKPGGAGVPARLSHEVYRTRHGVVQGWTTVKGQPVAVVNQRSTYGHDIDSVIGFLQFGDPHYTKDVRSWQRAASNIGFTFNWFYADDRDTGYFASGRLPRRNPAVETSLPTWGTGRAEWRGELPASQHVHDTNPAKGYFISWNNKPAPGQVTDNAYPYGQTFRSQLLVGQLDEELAAGKVGRADVVQAMAHAATQDLDGVTVVKELLSYAGPGRHSAGVSAMLAALRPWVASGAHRLKASPGDTEYASASAVAIADELVPNLVRALYDRPLGGQGESGVGSNGGASTAGYATLPMQWVNTPNSGGAHLGSAYDGGYEGYLMTTLQQLQGEKPADGFSGDLQADLCTGGPSTCRAAVEKALEKTYADLVTANGSSDVASWTASTDSKAAKQTMPEYDAIAFRALGIVGQPNIDWQNRPTFQQVVEFPRHRGR